MKNAIQNFQIPVSDFDRAVQFYSHVMGYDLQCMEFGGYKIASFRFDQKDGIGGSLIQAEGLEPSKHGTMVYLHAGEDLNPWLNRIEEAGGTLFHHKTPLGPGMGYYAIFDDTEGNRVGLYSTH
ncbi:VOC family protein [Roseivirga sp.]|uniref:VOC family protein n=1 Tax=Roseivirga sp. TaxID=1964215 RepID=UPI003B529FB2